MDHRGCRPYRERAVVAEVSRPRLLDLFCGAGGAAMGYSRAGFDVVGVDINPQPRFPFEFVQDDALNFPLDGFDAIHASPPCQHASTIAKQCRALRPGTYEHPNLVPQTRELLRLSGLPYVIENVVGAELENPIMLCGSSFGLDVRRHRLFECSFPIMAMPCAHHWQKPRFRTLDKRRHNLTSTVPVHGQGRQLASVVGVHGHLGYKGERDLRERAMGVDWMTPDELSQAIPPAYTEFIGEQLMSYILAVPA